MKLLTNENETPRDSGVDPEAAAAELRKILEASGEGTGLIAQCRALEAWAQGHGRQLGADYDLSWARLGGLEHCVWNERGIW